MNFNRRVLKLGLSLMLSLTSVATLAEDLTAGIIKRVDVANGKLTIKHEDIKSLDMPGMTMVFYLRDKEQVNQFAAGDQVAFAVQMDGNRMVLDTIQKIQQ